MNTLIARSCLLTVLGACLAASPSLAQIVPDTTLGDARSRLQGDQLIRELLSDRIEGGARRGVNLFHSFQEFNVAAGRGAYFANPDGIDQILVRVTGSQASQIQGTIGVLGNAHLFFLNPNGLAFSPTAQLDLRGSFVGSTASQFIFADGSTFSTENPQSAPLLAVSVPVGLGFSSRPGTIQVTGSGHRLTSSQPISGRYTATASTPSLRVQPNQTLALLGGAITLQGGILQAPQGHLELGGVGHSGTVQLQSTSAGLRFDYGQGHLAQPIQLTQASWLDVSGTRSGSIQLHGSSISLQDGSVALSRNQGAIAGGPITIHATEQFNLIGTTPNAKVRSSLFSETTSRGASGSITVQAPRVMIDHGGAIGSRSYSSGNSGAIQIQAIDRLDIQRFAPTDPTTYSFIASLMFGTGIAGDVTITTDQLSLFNGGVMASATFGRGGGGNMIVNARTIDVMGVTPEFTSSNISASSFSPGHGGNVLLNTETLRVLDSAGIAASGLGSGDAGNVIINASKSVEISGNRPGSIYPSRISSSVVVSDPVRQRLYGVGPMPSGNSGMLTVQTPYLRVSDQGEIKVRNEGIGDAGTLRIHADRIDLDLQGSLTAATIVGEGGNVDIHTDILQLRGNSSLTAATGSRGNGGMIRIAAGAIALVEGSQISANASQGRGGTIAINTRQLFKTEDSRITASSGIGIDGVVTIATANLLNPQNQLMTTPITFISSDQVIAGSCLSQRQTVQNHFFITGNGGFPQSPNGIEVMAYEENASIQGSPNAAALISSETASRDIVEATDLITTNEGRTFLVAHPKALAAEALLCH